MRWFREGLYTAGWNVFWLHWSNLAQSTISTSYPTTFDCSFPLVSWNHAWFWIWADSRLSIECTWWLMVHVIQTWYTPCLIVISHKSVDTFETEYQTWKSKGPCCNRNKTLNKLAVPHGAVHAELQRESGEISALVAGQCVVFPRCGWTVYVMFFYRS